MAESFYTILTKVGQAKIANATALGTKINFATLKVGDSNGTYYNPTEAQEDLVHTVWQGNINSITTDPDNPNWIFIIVPIPSDVGGFTIREVGIFDDEGYMLAVGKYPETYKPQAADGSTKEITIRTILEVSNSASVTLKIDPTVTLVTKEDLETVKNSIPQNASDIGAIASSQIGVTGGVAKQDDLTTLADDFGSHKADNVYQIPQISGTQIRINRLSNTNRLFFQLTSDLTGGEITISTDGGTTSKPLQDIDENVVTMLEKGFVEVVADANFFTLRNKGISATQKLQLIDIVNNAEANESTIKTNIANALNTKTDSSLTSSSSWIDIQNVISNMTNKRWKSGTSTSTSTILTLYYIVSGSSNFYKITIDNLPFVPSVIMLWYTYPSGNSQSYTIYNKDFNFQATGYNKMGKIVSSSGVFIEDGVTIGNTTIIGVPTPNNLYNWIAFE